MRAVVYARVSSAAQRDRDTIASQLTVLPAFVASQGWQLVDTYIDDGRSAKTGTLDARDGFARLVADAEAGRFDVVVVVDIDRLTRTDDMLERARILGPFQRAGIRIVTPYGGELDLRTMLGELYVTMQAIVAAEENRKRRERVLRGKLEAARRGRKITGRDPYGLVYSKASGWSLHAEQAPIAREVAERVAGGESCYRLADELNARGVRGPGPNGDWHRGRVYDLVRSRHLIGEYVAHRATRTIIDVPAIVDVAVWERAQDALKANRKAPLRRTKYSYLLEGLARCSACGGRMLVQSGCWAKGRFWRPAIYLCENRKNRKMGPDRCAAPKVHVDDADARAWEAIVRELEDPELPPALARNRRAREADVRDWEGDSHGFRAHLARLDRVEGALLVRFRRGAIGEAAMDAELAALHRERAAVRAQLAGAERAVGVKRSAAERAATAVATVDQLRKAMTAAAPAERVAIVRTMVNPGDVVFVGTAIRLELHVRRAQDRDDRGGALAAGQSWSRDDESTLRIRVVA